MITSRLVVLSSVLFLYACGGSQPAPTTATGADAEKNGAHKEHHKDHKELPPAIKAFHDEISPLWHADKGPDRAAKTCEKASVLKDKATAVNDKQLADLTVALVTECAKKDRPDFEAKFEAVHKQFHALKEQHEK